MRCLGVTMNLMAQFAVHQPLCSPAADSRVSRHPAAFILDLPEATVRLKRLFSNCQTQCIAVSMDSADRCAIKSCGAHRNRQQKHSCQQHASTA